jgi:predicted nucleotidyltransferase
MDEVLFPSLPLLTATEQSSLSRYVKLLSDSLEQNLVRVVVFGSVARSESWPAGMPIRSDLDLLVLTRTAVGEEVVQMLLDATLPLYLEAGRQISPQFRTIDQLEADDERAATFREHVARDGIVILDG